MGYTDLYAVMKLDMKENMPFIYHDKGPINDEKQAFMKIFFILSKRFLGSAWSTYKKQKDEVILLIYKIYHLYLVIKELTIKSSSF